MITGYIRFARRNWKQLCFGATLLALSSFGQTYFVSLSGTHFREAFGLSDGGLGAAYAVGTILSALTLTRVGTWIDYTSVRRFSWSVALLLASACVLVALSPNYIVLTVAFYFLRLGGQGLMAHTALTATARTFPADAGKAIGLVSLGFAAAQAVFPLATVALTDAIGWRLSWGVNAVMTLGGMALALLFLPRAADKPLKIRKPRGQRASETAPSLWRDPRLLLTLPAVLATPFIVTGFFFHQARLAEQKHWDIGMVASGFIAFSVVQALVVLAIGPAIDRGGPSRILPVFLVPQIVALMLLGFVSAPWVVYVYMILLGISAAIASTLATALWVELFGAGELARVRSTVEAGGVIASGASPIILGLLIDAGVPLSTQAIACAIYTLAASIVATRVRHARAPLGTRPG